MEIPFFHACINDPVLGEVKSEKEPLPLCKPEFHVRFYQLTISNGMSIMEISCFHSSTNDYFRGDRKRKRPLSTDCTGMFVGFCKSALSVGDVCQQNQCFIHAQTNPLFWGHTTFMGGSYSLNILKIYKFVIIDPY